MNKSSTKNFLSSGNRATRNSVSPKIKYLEQTSSVCGILLTIFIFAYGLAMSASAQGIYQPNYLIGNQPNNNYLANSSAFRQEIARVEINVVREGQAPLPLTQVPRLEKADVLKIRLLEEQVNGMKPDQSNWDWTFLVAFINPARNNEKQRLVSEEIQFRKSGWYKEYSFSVPYDSQPVFFFYTKPKYRDKILNLVSKNQEEIRKIGEKTIEISGAYAKIGSFLSELQFAINRYQSYGLYGNYNNSYGTYNSYGNNNYYGSTGINTGFNHNLFMEQSIERLARSFNISLPNCWQNGSYGAYNNYSNNGYNNNGIYNNYGYNNYGMTNDFIGRAQCVARSVRLEDFDVSISQMLQQGGILAATQLSQKYPQLAFWINIAAVALDFILKITGKTPLKIVPTVISTTENSALNYQQNPGFQGSNYTSPGASGSSPISPSAVKISLFAESPPNESNFVTAYPLVVHKWQANPDPAVITLPTPALAEQCLHAGQNILRSTDLLNDWMSDNFTKDFKLIISSTNGFRKEFPLKKNIGLGGWELNITKEDLNAFPKLNLALQSMIIGKRGFNEIRSPQFELPVPNGGSWEIESESQKTFAVGGKRRVVLKNQFGSCRCLQAVIYKPSFGGQFVYEANARANGTQFSEAGKEASFEIDNTSFQPGRGQLELRQYSGETINLNLNLYAPPPNVTDLRVSKDDNQLLINGERLEQIRAVRINGSRAIPTEGSISAATINNQPQSAYSGNSTTALISNQTNNRNVYPDINQTTGSYPNVSPSVTQGNYPVDNQQNYPGSSQTNNSNAANNRNSYPDTYQEGRTSVGQSTSPSAYPNNNANAQAGSQNNYPINNSGINQTDVYTGSNSANPVSQTERVFVFEGSNARRNSNVISLELELEDNRVYQYPRTFNFSPSRPKIVANEAKEIDSIGTNTRIKTQFVLNNLPVLPIETTQVSASLQNALTDYDFKIENIQIETRIENSQANVNELLRTNFEVLDWKNIQVSFLLNEQVQKLLSGRRLQFRILDRIRGNSDWYTLKNTFVRMPEIKTVKCAKDIKSGCEIKGIGIEYISQVSVDGGKSWYPQEPATLTTQSARDEQKSAIIPYYSNKKLLQIRLRDFRNSEGFPVNDYILSSK